MPVSQSPQTYYGMVPPPGSPGHVWATRDHRTVESAYVMANGPLQGQIVEGTASSINGTADVGLVIDGAIYSVTTPANLAALVAGLNAIPAFAAMAVASNPSGSTLRVVFSGYDAHTVTSYSPGTPDITSIILAQVASDPVYVRAGMGVCIDTTDIGDGEILTVKLPTTAEEAARCVGVVGAPIFGGPSPAGLLGLGYTADLGYPPGKAFALHREDYIRVLIGADVAKDGDMALGFAEATRGKWYPASAATGTAQVTRGDVVFNGTDAVGLTVDGYTVSVASNTSDDQTATDLVAKWNADATAFAKAIATLDISGTESYIILTFKDTATHTVVAYSPATADVVSITNTTTAVAAQAALVPGCRYSKGGTLTLGSAPAEIDLD